MLKFSSQSTKNSSELSSYIQSPRAEYIKNMDIVEWWNIKQEAYPILSKIARDYLTIMPTSVPSERTFSGGDSTITPNRASLHKESVRELMCLSSWNLIHFKQ